MLTRTILLIFSIFFHNFSLKIQILTNTKLTPQIFLNWALVFYILLYIIKNYLFYTLIKLKITFFIYLFRVGIRSIFPIFPVNIRTIHKQSTILSTYNTIYEYTSKKYFNAGHLNILKLFKGHLKIN